MRGGECRLSGPTHLQSDSPGQVSTVEATGHRKAMARTTGPKATTARLPCISGPGRHGQLPPLWAARSPASGSVCHPRGLGTSSPSLRCPLKVAWPQGTLSGHTPCNELP